MVDKFGKEIEIGQWIKIAYNNSEVYARISSSERRGSQYQYVFATVKVEEDKEIVIDNFEPPMFNIEILNISEEELNELLFLLSLQYGRSIRK